MKQKHWLCPFSDAFGIAGASSALRSLALEVLTLNLFAKDSHLSF